LIRRREGPDGHRQWYEFLVERTRDGTQYEFPQGQTLEAVLGRVHGKKMFFPSRDLSELQACVCHEMVVRDVSYKAYKVHFRATQHPKADRTLPPQPHFLWVAGAELSGHVHQGPPAVCGLPVAAGAVAAFAALPPKHQYATKTPPLVLYHGTSADACKAIAKVGLLPTATPGMLGCGVYLARWDKATRYAQRASEGVVVRCLLFPGRTRVMTADDACTCGCGQAYVDHETAHGKDYDTTYVPDNSLPATKHAEWCTRDSAAVVVDCLFPVKPGREPDQPDSRME
jgi:hypothetical protein